MVERMLSSDKENKPLDRAHGIPANPCTQFIGPTFPSRKKNEPVHSCSADLSAVKTTQDESVYVSHLLSGPSSQRTDEFMVQV